MQVGEHITVTGRVNEDWLEGSLQGRKGIFPASVIDRAPPGLSKVEEETKESSSAQQSGVDSKPTKVGVAQYKGVWHSTRGCGVVKRNVAQYKRVCGMVQEGVAHYVQRGCGTLCTKRVWHTTYKRVWHSTAETTWYKWWAQHLGVTVIGTKSALVSCLSCTPVPTPLCYSY